MLTACGVWSVQRGPTAVMRYLRTEPAAELQSVDFLMPCYSVPLYAYLHRNVPARLLDCSPPPQHLYVFVFLRPRCGGPDAEGGSSRSLKPLCAGCHRNQSTYVDEADRFYQDPLAFARERYRTGPVPSHVVLYSNLEERLRPVLDEYGFAKVRVRVRVTRCFPGDCRCVRSERYVWGAHRFTKPSTLTSRATRAPRASCKCGGDRQRANKCTVRNRRPSPPRSATSIPHAHPHHPHTAPSRVRSAVNRPQEWKDHTQCTAVPDVPSLLQTRNARGRSGPSCAGAPNVATNQKKAKGGFYEDVAAAASCSLRIRVWISTAFMRCPCSFSFSALILASTSALCTTHARTHPNPAASR